MPASGRQLADDRVEEFRGVGARGGELRFQPINERHELIHFGNDPNAPSLDAARGHVASEHGCATNERELGAVLSSRKSPVPETLEGRVAGSQCVKRLPLMDCSSPSHLGAVCRG